MAEQKIDRQAWAEIVATLIQDEAGGNKSRFAALIGVQYKTVNRWLNKEVDVSEETVRQIADRLSLQPMQILVRIGYYRAPSPADGPPIDTEDPAIQAVRDSELPPRRKRALIERIAAMQEEDRQRRLSTARWMIDHADS